MQFPKQHTNQKSAKPNNNLIRKALVQKKEQEVSGIQPKVHTSILGRKVIFGTKGSQAKLKVGEPNDKFEKEADAVADKVVSNSPKPKVGKSPAPPIQTMKVNAGDLQRKSEPAESVQLKSDDELEVQSKSNNSGASSTPDIGSALQNSKGSGQSMDIQTKSEMESGFGHDFSDVKIHTDGRSAQMNQNLGAKAFTNGSDIYFNRGEYRPETQSGKKLLAHELTHTIQQKNTSGQIQRSLKFEFQTNNYVMAISSDGKNTVTELPRKFGAESTSFSENSANEAGGNRPSYIATGAHGGSAVESAQRFVGIDAPKQLKKVKNPNNDPAEQQFTYLTKRVLNVGDKLAADDVQLIGYENNARTQGAKYEVNTVTYVFLDNSNTLLDIYVDENRIVQKANGFPVKMKIGEEKEWTEKYQGKDVKYNRSWPAEFTQKFKFKSARLVADLIGTPINSSELIELPVESNLNEQIKETGEFNPKTFDIQYLNADGSILDIHPDKDNTFARGREKLMRLEDIKNEEQTGMELQVEHGSYIEFETPKWFRSWEELKLRIADAVSMTKEITDPSKEITDPSILNEVRKTGKLNGKVYTWPFDTNHLGLIKSKKLNLIAIVNDPSWFAKIQPSDSIEMSEYGEMFQDRMYDMYHYSYYSNVYSEYLKNNPGKYQEAELHAANQVSANSVALDNHITPIVVAAKEKFTTPANKIFQNAFNKSTKINKPSDANQLSIFPSTFQNLRGFISLVLNYIYQGQTSEMYTPNSNKASYSKSSFFTMSRSDFSSIFNVQLSKNEQLLFKEIVQDPSLPLLKTLEPEINAQRATLKSKIDSERLILENMLLTETDTQKIAQIKARLALHYFDSKRWNNVTLGASSTLFADAVGSYKIKGPVIQTWLTKMSASGGYDLMSAKNTSGLSASHGVRKVNSNPNKKDYKKAQFEFRGGPYIPASEWLNYIENMFQKVKDRSTSTFDDLSTTTDETSTKTKLKK